MKILLTGDSWAAGDWNNQDSNSDYFTDSSYEPVLVELLENDGHFVMHSPHPAQSDQPSLYSVRENHSKVDFIIFFKTQCSRLLNKDNNERKYNSCKGEDWPSYDDYKKNNLSKVDQEIINEMLELGFDLIEHSVVDYAKKGLQLDEIFHKINHELVYKKLFEYKTKILLIGGIESIQTEYQFDYTINDLVSFLTKTANIDFTLSSSQEFVEFYKAITNSNLKLEQKNNLLSNLLKFYENNEKLKMNFFNNSNFFGPTDIFHPNETAIKLYYQECIKPKLEEFENDHRTNHQSQ